jgi:hypothetical protein
MEEWAREHCGTTGKPILDKCSDFCRIGFHECELGIAGYHGKEVEHTIHYYRLDSMSYFLRVLTFCLYSRADYRLVRTHGRTLALQTRFRHQSRSQTDSSLHVIFRSFRRSSFDRLHWRIWCLGCGHCHQIAYYLELDLRTWKASEQAIDRLES